MVIAICKVALLSTLGSSSSSCTGNINTTLGIFFLILKFQLLTSIGIYSYGYMKFYCMIAIF